MGFSTTRVGARAGPTTQRGTDPSPSSQPWWHPQPLHRGVGPLWGDWGCKEAQTSPLRSTVPGEKQAPQLSVGAGDVDVAVGPGVWDAVLAPGRAGGDHALPAEMEGVRTDSVPVPTLLGASGLAWLPQNGQFCFLST